jgi:hypothetical protein
MPSSLPSFFGKIIPNFKATAIVAATVTAIAGGGIIFYTDAGNSILELDENISGDNYAFFQDQDGTEVIDITMTNTNGRHSFLQMFNTHNLGSTGLKDQPFRARASNVLNNVDIVEIDTNKWLLSVRHQPPSEPHVLVNGWAGQGTDVLQIGTFHNAYTKFSGSGGAIFNELGYDDADIRMESDNDTNMFLLDSSADSVSIGDLTVDDLDAASAGAVLCKKAGGDIGYCSDQPSVGTCTCN